MLVEVLTIEFLMKNSSRLHSVEKKTPGLRGEICVAVIARCYPRYGVRVFPCFAKNKTKDFFYSLQNMTPAKV